MAHQRVPWFILPLTVFGWTKHFALGPCKSLLPQDLSSSFASAKPRSPFQEHVMFFHRLLLLHILYCFFHIQILLTWVPFYVLNFQALVTLKRTPLERNALEKSSICFLTTGLAFGDSVAGQGLRGSGRNPLVLRKSLEAKYMHKTSPSSVAFPKELCHPSR